MRYFALTLLWAVGALANAQDSGVLLTAVKEKVRQNLERLPDYICLQTVERSARDSPEAGFEMIDTIEIEVALIGDREMFAWPDSARFEQERIADLVQHGTIGNGDFALRLHNVFLTDAPEFTYAGTELLDGRSVVRFDFDVPVERSSYRLRVPPLQALVPFRGSFWADADSHDLVRLLVVVEQAPEALGVYEVRNQLDYERVSIGTADFLLPRSAELSIAGVKGNTSRNRMSFASCRQYVGESSISFNRDPGEPASAGAGAVAEGARDFRLPPRAELELELHSSIDTRKDSIGTPIEAIVAQEVQSAGGLVVPRGARAQGRLVHLELVEHPRPHYIIGLEFDSLEVGERRSSFFATMEKVKGNSAIFKPAKRLDPTFDKRRESFMQILVDEKRRGQGVIHWKAEKPVVPPGLKMTWIVEPER